MAKRVTARQASSLRPSSAGGARSASVWSRIALLLAWAWFLALPALGASGREMEENRKELDAIRQRIGQTARTLEEKKQAEKTAEADLKKIEATLAAMSNRVKSIEDQLADLDLRIQMVRGDIGQTGNEINGLKGQVQRRLVALYKGGDETLAPMLLSPRPAMEADQDILYWERIVRFDHRLLRRYRSQLTLQQQDLQQLDALRAEQEILRKDLQSGRLEMNRAARVKQQLLTKVRQDKDYLSRELAELQERASRVDHLIRKLETARSKVPAVSGTGFAAQKGQLSWPVAGRVRIPFGNSRHPDLGTPYQSHGIELEVTGERPVAAVWPGKVIFSDRFKGYGNLLILDHGDGYYTLYAHVLNPSCRVGERVGRGEAIATTDRQEARFYFEVRKGGAPLDPAEWLK